jgi:hypothetical protein
VEERKLIVIFNLELQFQEVFSKVSRYPIFALCRTHVCMYVCMYVPAFLPYLHRREPVLKHSTDHQNVSVNINLQ